MHSYNLALLAQSGLFVLGVYIEKNIRKKFMSRQRSKQWRPTTRIITMAIVTGLILLYNYDQSCAVFHINYMSFSDCFYLNANLSGVLQVIIVNSILFGFHIYQKFIKHGFPDLSRYTIKSVFIAPILEQILFRASFYRTAGQHTSIFIMSFLFAICHLHKPIRKALEGKHCNWNGAFGQVLFTFVFGVYSFYFLSIWLSVIPSIVLHCYCNFLGPPSIRKNNIYIHGACIIAMLSYCYLYVSHRSI